MKSLPLSFFNRPTLIVAQELLGKTLIHQIKESRLSIIVNEVEAYDGPHDKASHAHKGITPRNAVMFGEAGHWYLYLIYGTYWMLNITTGPRKYPAAILIRGGYTPEHTLISGPGKLTKYLNLDKSYNMLPATQKTNLWFEDFGIKVLPKNIKRKKRIGVDYATEWADKLYNLSFVL